VADEDQREIIIRPGLAPNCLHRVPELRCCGLRAYEGVDTRGGACGFEDAVEVVCGRSETLLVAGLSAKSGDYDIEGCSVRLESKQTGGRQQQGALHTKPHFRRSSHSAVGKPSRNRKNMGMFHNSLMVRTEMPASE
jgi:hypothetical protein